MIKKGIQSCRHHCCRDDRLYAKRRLAQHDSRGRHVRRAYEYPSGRD